MKSVLFSKYDFTQIDEFVNDFKKLLIFEKNVIDELPYFANRAFCSTVIPETEKIYEEASNRLGVPQSNLDQALNLSQFFLKEFTSMGDANSDSPEDIVYDLCEIYDEAKEKKDDLLNFLIKLKDLAINEVDIVLKRQKHAKAVLPNLVSISTVVDLRVVFNKNIKIDEEPVSYSPECLGSIPMGIIQIELSGEDNTDLVFQTDNRGIRILIDKLQGLEKQIECSKSYFNLEEKTDNE